MKAKTPFPPAGPAKVAKCHIFKTAKGEWMARLVTPNGEILASSESYTRKFNAHRWRDRVALHAATATVVESQSDPRKAKR